MCKSDYDEVTYMLSPDGAPARKVAPARSFPFAAFGAGMLLTLVTFPCVQPYVAGYFGGSVPPHPQTSTPTGDLVAAYRSSMLSRPLKNIIECKPGEECRMGADNRFKVLNQKGVTMWMTGLSGSGKTTISEALEKELLFKHGKNVYRIDGDNLRTGLTRDLGFSASDRGESVCRAAEVAALFNEAGIITMVTLISPYRKDRDPKGLYKKVAEGKIKGFTGIDSPYEAPLKP